MRILLIFMVVYYLPWYRAEDPGGGTPGRDAAPAEAAPADGAFGAGWTGDAVAEPLSLDNGMGGGFVPELVAVRENMEILGVPEPAEFSRSRLLAFTPYTIVKGDMIGVIAMSAGLNEDTLLSVNNIANSRLIQPNQVLRIPNQDGIYYTVQKGDTLTGIAEKHEVDADAIRAANELFSDAIRAGAALFIPGARMDWVNRQEINGDLFLWPLRGYISSNYGYRIDPVGGVARTFHTGIDIAAAMGTPIKAAMAGRVTAAGWSDTYGNYVVVSHHSGYRTLYGHMSRIRVKVGEYVALGGRLGDVGSTGVSTGPHLHFTVYKNGITVNPRTLMK